MDLSLPPRWPSEARFDAMEMLPSALYTLVDLTDEELLEVRQACEAACIEDGNEPNSSVRIAAQPRFIGQPLRAVFDHHVEWRARDAPLEFDPKMFVVVVNVEWQQKGVLIVTLDDQEDEGGNVDSFFTDAGEAGRIIVNIQIGNMGWDELKSAFGLEAGGEHGGDDGDDDDTNNPGPNALHEDGDEGGGSHHQDPDSDDKDLGGPSPPKESSNMGFYIPIYIHTQLQPDEVLKELEPMVRYKTPDDYACRIQDSLTPSPAAAASSSSAASHDLVAQAAALHPLRCARNQWLHQKMLIVIDTPDPVENGMLMVHLDWAGLTKDETSPRSSNKADLVAKGAALAGALDLNSCTIRLRYNCQYGLQNPFLTIAQGDARWPSETARQRSKFLVCQYNTPGAEWGFGVDLLYAGVTHQQEYSQEQLVLDQELIVREQYNGTAENFEEAILKFPMVCRENRFVENFDTRHFICIDRVDIAETGVLLVRRHWDGNVWKRTDQELMELDVVGVRSVRVAVKDALRTLEKGRAGNTEGMSPELVEFFGDSD